MSHYYRFDPTVEIQSNAHLCWAASLSSWLTCIYQAKGKVTSGTWSGKSAATYGVMGGTAWSRDLKDQDELIDQFSPNLDANNGLTKAGLKDIYESMGMTYMLRTGSRINYAEITKLLKDTSHLYMAYFSHSMYHAVVVYGVSTTDGIAVMDPWPGEGLVHRKTSFFADPLRANKDVFIGWAMK